jgi:hypothetical protein
MVRPKFCDTGRSSKRQSRRRSSRSSAEAANQSAAGFFQGIGFAAGAGIFALIVGVSFLIVGATAGVLTAYKMA